MRISFGNFGSRIFSSLRFRNCPRIFPNRKRCFEGKGSIFVLGRRVILLSREVLIDASQRENAWRTRESGLLPVPKTFEPRTGAQPDRFAALPNPGIHSPIPPEIEPDVLTDMCRLRVAQGGFRQMLACCAYDAHRLIRCMRMVVVCLVVSDVRYRAIL